VVAAMLDTALQADIEQACRIVAVDNCRGAY
jgi:hypothetical protein